MNKLKQMDKTKKLTILCVIVSLLVIVCVGIYKTLQPTPLIVETIITEEEVIEEVKEETKEETTSSTDSSTTNSQTKKDTSKDTTQNTTTTTKQETTQTTTQETSKQEATQSVSIKVTGMNETIMSGTVTIKDGDTAYSVLKTLASSKGVTVKTSGFGSMVYVKQIGDLKEKEHGSSSGWVYKVNGSSPNVGAASYELKNNDQVTWSYIYE